MSEINRYGNILEALRDPKMTAEVAKELGVSAPTTLRKLRKLYSAGMISKVLDGEKQKWMLDDSLHDKSPVKRVCYATLMQYMTTSPQSIKQLCGQIGWSRDTVSRYLQDLEDKGLVMKRHLEKIGKSRYGWHLSCVVATQDVVKCEVLTYQDAVK